MFRLLYSYIAAFFSERVSERVSERENNSIIIIDQSNKLNSQMFCPLDHEGLFAIIK